jgi:hypothetical protein
MEASKDLGKTNQFNAITAIGSDDEMMDIGLLDLEACLPPAA